MLRRGTRRSPGAGEEERGLSQIFAAPGSSVTNVGPVVPDNEQLGFDFQPPREGVDGYSRWQSERRAAQDALARKLGFPIGHEVEVELLGQVLIRGMLRLVEDGLWMESNRDFRIRLRVDRCEFAASEIVRCVRLD